MIIRSAIFILIVFFSFSTFSQEDGKPTNHAIRFDFKLPSAVANRSFKGIMSGLADVDLAYSYHFDNIGLLVSGGLKYGYWSLESSVFSNAVVTGKLDYYSPFLGLGYRSKVSDNVFVDLELLGGYSFMNTVTNNCPDPFKQNNFHINPKIGLYLKGSDLLYFGVCANYNFINEQFTPNNICLPSFPGLGASDSEGQYQYFSIGFGCYAIIPEGK